MTSVSMRIHILLLLLLGGLISMQLNDTHLIQPAAYKQIHSSLNSIVRLDAVSEESMMQLQNGQIGNYDKLTADAVQLMQRYTELDHALPDEPSLQAPLQALKASVRLQLDTIDAFRRSFGILLNSKRYASTLIAQSIDEHPSLTVPLLRLRGDLFEFLSFPNDALKQRIVMQQKALEPFALADLNKHLKIMLQYISEIQHQIYTVLHCGTPENTYSLLDAYDVVYTKQIQKMESRRFWLFGLIALFAIYLVMVLYLLMRSDRKLRAANDELEASRDSLEQELKARRQTETRYRTLVDSSAAAIMTYADNRFMSANRATLHMFGVEEEKEMLEMGATDISPPQQADGRDSATADLDYIKIAMRDGRCAFEWLNKRKNGEVFPAYVQLTAIEVGNERMMQAVITDLSDLKRLEKEKELLANALENTADAVMITDAEARILYVNTSFELLTGYSSSEVTGQFTSILRSEKEDVSVYERIFTTLNHAQTWKGELLMRLKSGDEIATERTISPILNESGGVINHVAVMRDVTEEKEQAKKWEHTQRLESLGKAWGQVLKVELFSRKLRLWLGLYA